MLNDGDRIEFLEIKTLKDFLDYIDKDIPMDNILINGEKPNKETVLKDKDQIVAAEIIPLDWA